MIKRKIISKILCIAFSALAIAVYGKIAPLSVQGQGTASSRTGLFDIISGIFKNDYHESTMEMEESKTPKQRITGSISYILSDSGKCCEPSNPPTFSTPSKLPDHSNCSENEECESDRCEKTPTCIFIACCIPETGLNNGSRCNSKDQCMSDYCNESNVCSEKRPINSGCQADEDCVSGLVCNQRLCKIGVGETCENHNECETGRCSKENKCKVKEIVGGNCEQNVDCDTDICSDNICKLGVGETCEDDNECETGRCSKENKCNPPNPSPVNPPVTPPPSRYAPECNNDEECGTDLCCDQDKRVCMDSDSASCIPSIDPCSIQQFIGQSFEKEANGYTYRIDNMGNTGSTFKQFYSNLINYHLVGTFSEFSGVGGAENFHERNEAIYTHGLDGCPGGKERSGIFEIEETNNPAENGVMTASEPEICFYRFVRKCYRPSSDLGHVESATS